MTTAEAGSQALSHQAQRRGIWTIIWVSLAASLLLLATGTTGYWRYVNLVPSSRLSLPPMPRPNGYDLATQAMYRAQHAALPPHWPAGTRAQLEAPVRELRAALDGVRAAFHLEWRHPPAFTSPEESVEIHRSGLCIDAVQGFLAEARLSRLKHEPDAALASSLDVMELAAHYSWGGDREARPDALAWHRLGFREAASLVPLASRDALARALRRVRRIRSVWPPLAETIETWRAVDLARTADEFRGLAAQPAHRQFVEISRGLPNQTLGATLRLLLTPRQTVLLNRDRYYRQLVAETRKPVRRRRRIPYPMDVWNAGRSAAALGLQDLQGRLERPLTDFALLEVALAVHLYRADHGAYPGRLAEIPVQWLPKVPLDLWQQPIAYRLIDGRPLIYSLGPDGVDDGGRILLSGDAAASAHGDIVFNRESAQRRGSGAPALRRAADQ
jgi:hypothetical protein